MHDTATFCMSIWLEHRLHIQRCHYLTTFISASVHLYLPLSLFYLTLSLPLSTSTIPALPCPYLLLCSTVFCHSGCSSAAASALSDKYHTLASMHRALTALGPEAAQVQDPSRSMLCSVVLCPALPITSCYVTLWLSHYVMSHYVMLYHASSCHVMI